MSEIVVRPYEPRDQEEVWRVRETTYNSGRPIPIEKQVFSTTSPYVAELDGKVVGTFVILDMTCTRGPLAEFKTGGIAAVAVAPEARQSGVGGAMMRWSLRHMREKGYVLGALYAFRESFYRKFGYEVCGMRYRITCPQARLPRWPAELPVRRIGYKHLDAIKPCYERFARQRSGMNVRTDLHWRRIIIDDQVKTIYAVGDPVEAYALLEHDETFWNEQSIQELVWTTERGYSSIMSFIGQLASNKTSASWNEPRDSPFVARCLDQGIRVESEKPIMFRLLDPEAALRQLSAEASGEFSLEIDDPDLPENRGPWQVVYGPQEPARVAKSERSSLTLTARQAVQAILGQPSLSDLARHGSIPSVPAAEALLPPIPVYCIDHF